MFYRGIKTPASPYIFYKLEGNKYWFGNQTVKDQYSGASHNPSYFQPLKLSHIIMWEDRPNGTGTFNTLKDNLPALREFILSKGGL